MNKKTIIICILLITIVLVIYSLVGTFASDSTVSIEDTYNFTITGSTGEITVPAGTSKTVLFQITNTNKGVVKYGVAYSGTDITVKYYSDTIDPVTGILDYGESKFIKLYIKNSSTVDRIAIIKEVLGYENGGELTPVIPEGYTLVTEMTTGDDGISGQLLSQYIENLYNNKIKTIVTNNDINYYYAKEVSLMNDRLGGTTDNYNDGNIRYYGADPNNYIYFNCLDYDNPTKETCETWRIIGLFKDVEMADGSKQDLVKIIRIGSIGNLAWDSKFSGIGTSISEYGSNDWTDARLMMLLNDGYETPSVTYEYEGSLYWNARSGTCYYGQASSGSFTRACSFTSRGLQNDETRNMIAEVVWNLGGTDLYLIYANQMYEYERSTMVYDGRPAEWTGKVALMYLSDYGYATDFRYCNKTLHYYKDAICYENDWMYIAHYEWSLTPYYSEKGYDYALTGFVKTLDSSGTIQGTSANSPLNVRPVFYLNSDVKIISGTGTEDYPYVIG